MRDEYHLEMRFTPVSTRAITATMAASSVTTVPLRGITPLSIKFLRRSGVATVRKESAMIVSRKRKR
jgi:hypothetical protein